MMIRDYYMIIPCHLSRQARAARAAARTGTSLRSARDGARLAVGELSDAWLAQQQRAADSAGSSSSTNR